MAHNIATINGKSAIAYVGETPWHRLGQEVAPGIGLEAAFEAASLNWDVKAVPTFARIEGVSQDADGNPVATFEDVELTVQAIIREDSNVVLGTVGPRFTPIQHRDAFRTLNPAIESGQLDIEVLGALGKGETVWLLLKLNEPDQTIRTLADGTPDVVRPYVLAQLGHDGSRAFSIKPTAVRVVCNNTLSVSDHEGVSEWVSIRHTESADKQLKVVGKAIEQAAAAYRATCDLYRQLAAVELTEEALLAYIEEVLPLPEVPKVLLAATAADAANAANALLAAAGVEGTIEADSSFEERSKATRLRYETEKAKVEAARVQAAVLATTGKGNDGSTLWDAYNGITELVDHTAPRATEHAINRAAFNAVAGSGLQLKDRALDIARELVAA